VLFATFQIELFELIIKWVDFAKLEIATWPRTDGLGMTERTRALLSGIEHRRSVMAAPPPTGDGLAASRGEPG
jgi:hypothetical protein